MEIKIIKKTKVNLDLSAEHTYYGKIKGKPNLYFTDRLESYTNLTTRDREKIAGLFILLEVLELYYILIFGMLQSVIISFLVLTIPAILSFLIIYFLKPTNKLSFSTTSNEAFDKHDNEAANIITNAVDNYIAFNKLKDKNYKESISKITINSTKASHCDYCNSHIVNSKCQGRGAK